MLFRKLYCQIVQLLIGLNEKVAEAEHMSKFDFNFFAILFGIAWGYVLAVLDSYIDIPYVRPDLMGYILLCYILGGCTIIFFIYRSGVKAKKKLKKLMQQCPIIPLFELNRVEYDNLGRIEIGASGSFSNKSLEARVKFLQKAISMGANAVVLEDESISRTTENIRAKRGFSGDFKIESRTYTSGARISGYAIKIYK